MGTFSERYGYIKPTNIIIRERITEEIQNAICNCLEQLNSDLREHHSGYSYSFSSDPYALLEEYVWMYFLNKKQSDFWGYESRKIVISLYIEEENPWYKKLDLLEFIINHLHNTYPRSNTPFFFIRNLNNEFKRLNFAYRVIEEKVVEVNSEEEIAMIEVAINNQKDNVKSHLQKAIELYAKRPTGDFQNSIKESISAVEAYCREVTGETTLGKALSKLESAGLMLHPMLKTAFEKLYVYTNDPKTGIRHSLMDSTRTYTL